MDFTRNPQIEFIPVGELSLEQAAAEIVALREGIEYHNHRYYTMAQPDIADSVYDALLRRLQELEQAFPQLQSPDSPTQRVGARLQGRLAKRDHAAAMLSLDGVPDADAVDKFYDFILRTTGRPEVSFVVEPKFDGLSVEVVYRNGVFEYAATRGDGIAGDDISQNLKATGSVPLQLQSAQIPRFLAIRGEVYMDKHGFQQLNKFRIESGMEAFSNPRNAAAGLMRQLDPAQVSGKPLHMYVYDILACEGMDFHTDENVLHALRQWGFRVPELIAVCLSRNDVTRFRETIAARRDELDYEIDGIVMKVNEHALRRQLGTRQRTPRWAIAWKFTPRQEITRLVDIIVSVGKSGALTPVALLEPVEVGGVTVSRASLHNEEEVRKKDIQPGDMVRVARAGDVIPEIVERVSPGTAAADRQVFTLPRTCPVCAAQVLRRGAHYYCTAGLSCKAQLIGRIVHFAGRNALNIEGLGYKTAQMLVEQGLVRDLSDMYRLRQEDIEGLPGFAQKSATQLIAAIAARRQIRLDRFLYAVGIAHIGERVAGVLARNFLSLSALQTADNDELLSVHEIGPEIAASVHAFFAEPHNRTVMERFTAAGVTILPVLPEPNTDRSACTGKTFVLTGELSAYSRKQAQELITVRGGRVSSSISKKTDFLLAGAHPGSKYKKAQELGIPVIDEQGFNAMLEI